MHAHGLPRLLTYRHLVVLGVDDVAGQQQDSIRRARGVWRLHARIGPDVSGPPASAPSEVLWIRALIPPRPESTVMPACTATTLARRLAGEAYAEA